PGAGAGGVRRAASLGDPVPDRLSDLGRAAGVGGGYPRPASAGPARASAAPPPPCARDARAAGPPVVGRNDPAVRDPCLRWPVGRAPRGRHGQRGRSVMPPPTPSSAPPARD